MPRIYNFSAGPAVLPLPVLEKAQKDMLDYEGCGYGIMEMSHRSAVFQAIVDDARNKLRQLMNIPDGYQVLFLQGGASLQFAMVPMNLLPWTAAPITWTAVPSPPRPSLRPKNWATPVARPPARRTAMPTYRRYA
jgi:phosphoserine aminotransferase